jgi:hypothetical protein
MPADGAVLSPGDRVQLAARCPDGCRGPRQTVFFVTPATLLRWHRELVGAILGVSWTVEISSLCRIASL